jgi:hypothetical protein
MIKKIFGLIACCCLITSCATIVAHSSGMSQQDSAYKIVPKNAGENRAIAVFYGYDFLKAIEDKKAETEMREPNYNSIPKFGYISVSIKGWTADTANPRNWLFIVQDGNRTEIYRDNGSDRRARGSISDLGNYYTTSWSNLHNIYLKEDAVFPLYLRVVSATNDAIDITIMKK